jgi:hypothetical protein
MAIYSEYGTKKCQKPAIDGKSVAKTSKYSSSLISVPIGSLSLINPEKIKTIPTKKRENCAINFISCKWIYVTNRNLKITILGSK